jgi:hypothetical protein
MGVTSDPKPASAVRLRVLFNHQVVAEYPADHDVMLRGDAMGFGLGPGSGKDGDLVVFVRHPDGIEFVAAHEAGTWHVGGLAEGPYGDLCGFVDPDPDCPRCHPKPPAVVVTETGAQDGPGALSLRLATARADQATGLRRMSLQGLVGPPTRSRQT